jgi:hypothetical protein
VKLKSSGLVKNALFIFTLRNASYGPGSSIHLAGGQFSNRKSVKQNDQSRLEHKQRRKLHGHPTAKHLHAYYSSHAKPTAHRIAKLAQLAGVMNSNSRQRKVTVVKAHDLLTASDIGFLSTYEVKGDTIKVQINHTASQLKHITDKPTGKLKRARKKTRDSVDGLTG